MSRISFTPEILVEIIGRVCFIYRLTSFWLDIDWKIHSNLSECYLSNISKCNSLVGTCRAPELIIYLFITSWVPWYASCGSTILNVPFGFVSCFSFLFSIGLAINRQCFLKDQRPSVALFCIISLSLCICFYLDLRKTACVTFIQPIYSKCPKNIIYEYIFHNLSPVWMGLIYSYSCFLFLWYRLALIQDFRT